MSKVYVLRGIGGLAAWPRRAGWPCSWRRTWGKAGRLSGRILVSVCMINTSIFT